MSQQPTDTLCKFATHVDYLQEGRVCSIDRTTCFNHSNPEVVNNCVTKQLYHIEEVTTQ